MRRARNWMVIMAAAVFCLHLNAAPARSQVGFILGVTTGILFSGDGNHESSAIVLYTLADVSRRVKDPLGIRLSSISIDYSRGGMEDINCKKTFRELFSQQIEESEKYEILQIVRVFLGTRACIWFAYIEKESVLPPIAQK